MKTLLHIFISFISFFLLLNIFFSKTSCAQNSTSVLGTVVSESSTGAPDTLDWSASTLDTYRLLVTTGNTLVANGTTDMLITKYTRTGKIDWQHTYDAASSYDYGTAVTSDDSANIYVAVASYISSTNGYDYVLRKYDSSGAVKWTQTYNGPGSSYDVPADLKFYVGKIFITGTSTGSTTGLDYCTLKYDRNGGSPQWTSRYDYTSYTDIPATITVSPGNIIISGGSGTTLTNWDFATVRYKVSTGAQISVIRSSSSGLGFDHPTAAVTDQNSNIYVCGSAAVTSNGYDVKIEKLDSVLNSVWSVTWDGQHLDDQANSIELDANGYIYVTGFSKKTNGGTDYITIKYSPSGAVVWTKRYMAPDETDVAEGKKLSIDLSGVIYITGRVERKGNYDFCTIVYDTSGALQMEKFFAGDSSGNDNPAFIKIVDDKYLYVCGKSTMPASNHYYTLKYDIYKKENKIKYDTNSNPLYVEHEIIVRFDPSVIDTANVDNKNMQFGELDSFLNSATVSAVKYALGVSTTHGEHMMKIFENLTTKNKTSITRLGEKINIPEFWACFILELPIGMDEQLACTHLKTLFPVVRYAELNRVGQPHSNDPYYWGDQESLHPVAGSDSGDINVEPAWDHCSMGKSFVTVGVCDFGISWSHDDFSKDSSNSWSGSKVRGYDYETHASIENEGTPPESHGQDCAGIIGAITNNSKGISGIAGGNALVGNYGVKLFDMRIGYNAVNAIANAIVESAANDTTIAFGYGHQIQNHSWGYDSGVLDIDTLDLLQDAVRFAFKNQVVFVASRGNLANYEKAYPACFHGDWILCTGSSDAEGEWLSSPSSRYGNGMDFIAPGQLNLITTTALSNSSYEHFEGTSAAAPHVSGIAALMLSYANDSLPVETNLSIEDVQNVLDSTTEDRGQTQLGYLLPGYDSLTAWGLVNAGNALLKIRTPKYHILHYKVTDDVCYDSLILNESLVLNEPYGSIQAGSYLADYHKFYDTVDNNLGIHDTILGAWVRNSSSDFLGKPYGIFFRPETSIKLEKITHDYTIISGYYYIITSYGSYTGDYLPFDPADSAGRLSYSLWVNDTSIIDSFSAVPIIPKNVISMHVFPNPTSKQFSVLIHSPEFIEANINLYDMVGTLRGKMEKNMQIKGTEEFTFKTSDLEDGIYFITLENNHVKITQSLVIIKN